MTTKSPSPHSAHRPDPAGSPVVGVIGLGDMGAAIAAAVLQKFPLVAFDIRPAAVEKLVAVGAQSVRSVAEVAQLSDIIIILVVDDRQVMDVVGQILGNPGRTKYLVISSTVLPATCMSLGEQAKSVRWNSPIRSARPECIRSAPPDQIELFTVSSNSTTALIAFPSFIAAKPSLIRSSGR